ncbi:MAG: hypothetical protein KL863_28705 [Rhizobium sp.]|nr:hypothetical protein [Rhizobium sp.]
MTVMSQRVKVQEMVMQMHEKNLVLMNIVRDIAENETSLHLPADITEEEIGRSFADKAVRRKALLDEILDLLCREDMARRVGA